MLFFLAYYLQNMTVLELSSERVFIVEELRQFFLHPQKAETEAKTQDLQIGRLRT